MDSVKAKTYRSRKTTAPRLNKNSQPTIARPMPRDVETFKLLATRDYRVARLNMLHALLGEKGGGFLGYQAHMELLSIEPNLYVSRNAHQWRFNHCYNRSSIYEIAPNGIAYLNSKDIEAEIPKRIPPDRFRHEVLWNEIIQSIELGTLRTPGFRFLSWSRDIKPRAPKQTLESNNPFDIPIEHVRDKGGKDAIHTATPDGFPFGIEGTDDDGQFYYFMALEADCDTEDARHLEHKVRDYIKILEGNIFEKHFGVPNCFPMFVTTNNPQKRRIANIIGDLTEKKKHLREFFLLNTFLPFDSDEIPPPPTGHMLTMNYERVGLPDFNFTTS